jgi:hypothetical protein
MNTIEKAQTHAEFDLASRMFPEMPVIEEAEMEAGV